MNHKIFFTFDASGKYKYMYIIGPTLILMYMYTTKRYERNEKNDSNETRPCILILIEHPASLPTIKIKGNGKSKKSGLIY